MPIEERTEMEGLTFHQRSMQVSHHPPIFAFHTESNCRSYQCYGEIEIKNKFWGRSIEVTLSSKTL